MKFLGFLLFLTIALIGFSVLTFLISIVFYWIGGYFAESMGLIKDKNVE
ncbi:MAG: hypothetical protein KAG37_04800 [Flavobacteriales bacterium]|nr:hypothetical protein [Flavobacteriales bacterium]